MDRLGEPVPSPHTSSEPQHTTVAPPTRDQGSGSSDLWTWLPGAWPWSPTRDTPWEAPNYNGGEVVVVYT